MSERAKLLRECEEAAWTLAADLHDARSEQVYKVEDVAREIHDEIRGEEQDAGLEGN